ncbi:MAG: SDR family NAD(P)-dependent oxidoreductase [Planctomycetota bacterium]|jgi:NAD(P)-dependent dehydrogenase (short-subunit alcohol dehydrogenase family)
MSLEAFSLAGKHVVIVGASSGIGKAAAVRCAEAGARVSACARREEHLDALVSQLAGADHGWLRLDVRELPDIETVFQSFAEERGPVDGLIYAAGIEVMRPLNVIDEAQWANVVDVNLRGAVFCSKAAQGNTVASREGMSIVLLSSIAAWYPMGAAKITYSATKAALNGVMRAAAMEGARRNIRVNSIMPAAVRTEIWEKLPMTESQREKIDRQHLLGVGEADDVAYACVYLTSPAARWITGTVLVLDGGYSLC